MSTIRNPKPPESSPKTDWVAADVLRGVLRHAAALLAPPVCLGCRRAQQAADALALCPTCLSALPWIVDPCRRCGLPVAGGGTPARGHGSGSGRGYGDHGRAPCPAADAPWSTAWAPVLYQGPAAGLVRALKFRGALPLLDLMAAQMTTNLPDWSRPDAREPQRVAGPEPVVVPVPPSLVRRRRRGFDAADGLAVRVSQRLGLEVQRPLRRVGGGRQLGATGEQRRAEDRLDIRIRSSMQPPRGAIMLVDDVHTTGATLRAASHALQSAGAREIHVLTYARTA